MPHSRLPPLQGDQGFSTPEPGFQEALRRTPPGRIGDLFPAAPQRSSGSHLRYKIKGQDWREYDPVSGESAPVAEPVTDSGAASFFETPESQLAQLQQEQQLAQARLNLARSQPFTGGELPALTVGEELGLRGQERTLGARYNPMRMQFQMMQQELAELEQAPELQQALAREIEIARSPYASEEERKDAQDTAEIARQSYNRAYQNLLAKYLAGTGRGLPGQFFGE